MAPHEAPSLFLLHTYARRMRREGATRSEEMLWRALKGRKLCGVKFRRQHVVAGSYIVDFVALSHRLVVEVDGGVHREPERAVADAARQGVIEGLGFRGVRVAAEVVERDVGAAVAQVRAALAR